MKKGFTLVELLAVIAILAILIILALPNVLKLFHQAKKNSFANEVNILYGVAEKEYVKDTFNNSKKRVYVKSPVESCSKELPANVRDNIYYYVEMDKTGKVTKFYMYDDDFQYIKGNNKDETIVSSDDVDDLSESSEKMIITCNNIVYTSNDSSSNKSEYTFLLTGSALNQKLKKLANPDFTSITYNTVDENITAIKRSQTPPSEENMKDDNLISLADSKDPVYAWYDEASKTIYYYSKSSKILLNKSGIYAFSNLTKLTDISGLSDFDTSNVTNMSYMFVYDTSLENLEPISNWNTKRVTTMTGTFAGSMDKPMIISSLKPLSNWDTSSLTTLYGTFQCNIGYTSLEGLENWNTSKVINMQYTFFMNKSLTTLKGIENFDTSKVTNMGATFHECHNLKDASAIENWDVSNVIYMHNMFNISDRMSPKYSSLKKLDLSKWNMAKVKYYNWWVESLRFVDMEVTIRSTQVVDYRGIFQDTSNYCSDADHTNYTCQIVVNYTSETEELVDKMVATKSKYSNVVKGRLVE